MKKQSSIGSMAVHPVLCGMSALLIFGCMSHDYQSRGEANLPAKMILHGMRQIVEQDVIEDPLAVERAIKLTNGWESLTYYRANGAPIEFKKTTGWDGKDQNSISDFETKIFMSSRNEESETRVTLQIDRAQIVDTRKRLVARLSADLQPTTAGVSSFGQRNCLELHEVLGMWPEATVTMHSEPPPRPRLPGLDSDYISAQAEIEGLWGVSLRPAGTGARYTFTARFRERKCAHYLMLLIELNSRR